MSRGSKVDPQTSPLDDDDDSDVEFEKKMENGFGKKATKRIMYLMKEI
jgi:hypothetical protein